MILIDDGVVAEIANYLCINYTKQLQDYKAEEIIDDICSNRTSFNKFKNDLGIDEIRWGNDAAMILLYVFSIAGVNVKFINSKWIQKCFSDSCTLGFKFKDIQFKENFKVTLENIEGLTNAHFYGWPINEITLNQDCTEFSFFHCELLNKVNIQGISNWSVLPEGMFNHCLSLEHIDLPDCIEVISNSAFAGGGLKSIKLPKSLKEIGRDAFLGCNSLETVIFNDELETIKEWAFGNCPKLDNIELPANLKVIKQSAFSGCNFTKFKLPDNVSGDNYLFKECEELREITIPSSWNNIPEGMFFGCVNLEKVILPPNCKKIKLYAFTNCSKLKDINIPNTVIEIGDYAFFGCTQLTSIVIPDSVKIISYAAFRSSGLTSVTLGNGIMTIADEAFLGTKLSELTLPNSLRNFYSTAVRNCGLKELNFKGTINLFTTILHSGRGISTNVLSLLNYGIMKVNCTDGVLDLKEVNKK